MSYTYRTPAVYREEVFLRPAEQLPTGVPGFVGFGQTSSGGPVLLHRADDLAPQFVAAPIAGAALVDAVRGFFANGGRRCYVVGALPDASHPALAAAGLAGAISKLGPLADLDLVAAPDAMLLHALDPDASLEVQRAVLAHCAEHGNRFALLDTPPDLNPAVAKTVDALKALRDALGQGGANMANAAIYYPWVLVETDAAGRQRAVPPCGHVAGVYARSDGRVGVFKAPANEELLGLADLEFEIDAVTQDSLNPEGINCLRAFPGRGLRVWGARTLSSDPSWRYVNVRRVFLTLGRWIERNMTWATFEPNDARLWNRITRELDGYLAGLLQQGALRGGTAAQAYYIKCDAETNPAEDRETGRVTTVIGLAPAVPGEFVVVRIVQREGAALLSA